MMPTIIATCFTVSYVDFYVVHSAVLNVHMLSRGTSFYKLKVLERDHKVQVGLGICEESVLADTENSR